MPDLPRLRATRSQHALPPAEAGPARPEPLPAPTDGPPLRRHRSEGPAVGPATPPPPRTPGAPGRTLRPFPSAAQAEFLACLGGLSATWAVSARSPAATAGQASVDAAGPMPVPDPPPWCGGGEGPVADCRRLAPELMDDDAPITVGAAVLGPDGRLFDAARYTVCGLAARLDGAPLVPCLAADELLEWLAAHPGATSADFAEAAAQALRCPIELDVPAAPVTARDGVTYGGGALALHLGTQRRAGSEPWLPMSREPQVGPLPRPNRSLVALATRLGLITATAIGADAEARLAAEALEAGTGPDDGADDALSTWLDAFAAPIGLLASGTFAAMPTAFDAHATQIAFGDADGSLTLMVDDTLEVTASWQAHRARVGGRGGVAQVALAATTLVSLGGFVPGSDAAVSVPKIWSHAGSLLHRLQPALPETVRRLCMVSPLDLAALTVGGDLISWHVNPTAARLSRYGRRLGADATVGFDVGSEATAIAGGGRLELTTPSRLVAGPLALPTSSILALQPSGDAVIVLDHHHRAQLFTPSAQARPGWPVGALVPVPAPGLLDGRTLTALAGFAGTWAAADAAGNVAVFRGDGSVVGEVHLGVGVAYMAMQHRTLNLVTENLQVHTYNLRLD